MTEQLAWPLAPVTAVHDCVLLSVSVTVWPAMGCPVTVLVNAAGLDHFKRFGDIALDDWQRVIDVNLNGVFHCVQAVLPDMIAAGWGRIVNISSSSTHSGQPYMAAYVAAVEAGSIVAAVDTVGGETGLMACALVAVTKCWQPVWSVMRTRNFAVLWLG